MACGVVTVSASYGTGGSIVGPEVARRLGLPFLDRAIPAAVARELSVSLDDALAHEEHTEGVWGRLIAAFARVPEVTGAGVPLEAQGAPDEQAFCRETERVLRELADSGGVILGRAAQIVLADRRDALHVRLDGPEEGRRVLAARRGDLSDEEAAELQRTSDRGREGYVAHFYRTDVHDPALYHVIIDGTVVGPDACVEMIVTAARSR